MSPYNSLLLPLHHTVVSMLAADVYLLVSLNESPSEDQVQYKSNFGLICLTACPTPRLCWQECLNPSLKVGR